MLTNRSPVSLVNERLWQDHDQDFEIWHKQDQDRDESCQTKTSSQNQDETSDRRIWFW